MNTIVRNQQGQILIYSTVLKTVKTLLSKPGMFTISEIQTLINNQLTLQSEFFTRDEVKRAIVLILQRSQNRA